MSLGLDRRQLVLSCLLLLLTAVWGWTFSTVKTAVESYGVLSFLTVRFGIATLVLAPFALRRIRRETWPIGAGIGLALAGGYLFQTYGARGTSASNNGLITGLFVIFAPTSNWLLYRVRTSKEFWFALLLSVLGLALLAGGLGELRYGDFLTMICAASFGLQIALLDRHAGDHSALGLAFVQLATATAVFAVACPFCEPLVAPPPAVLRDAVLLAIFATAAGFVIQTVCQRDLPAVRTAILLSTEPVWAAIFGWVAGDRLRPLQWVGAAVMVTAVGLAEVLPAAKAARRAARLGPET